MSVVSVRDPVARLAEATDAQVMKAARVDPTVFGDLARTRFPFDIHLVKVFQTCNLDML